MHPFVVPTATTKCFVRNDCKNSSPCQWTAQMTDSRLYRGFGQLPPRGCHIIRARDVNCNLCYSWIVCAPNSFTKRLPWDRICLPLLFRASSPQRAGETVCFFRCGHTGMTEKASGLTRECVWTAGAVLELWEVIVRRICQTAEQRMVYKLKGIAVKAKWKCLVSELWKVRQEVHWTWPARWVRMVLKRLCTTNHHCKVYCKNLSHAHEKKLSACKRVNDVLHHPWEDPCQSAEDEARGDQVCVLVHSLHLHCFPSALYFSSAFYRSPIGDCEEWKVCSDFLLLVAKPEFLWRLVDSLLSFSLVSTLVPDHWSQVSNCFHIGEVLFSWPFLNGLLVRVRPSIYNVLLSIQLQSRNCDTLHLSEVFPNGRILFLRRVSQGFLCFETNVLLLRLSRFYPARSSLLYDEAGYWQ